jgi:hypothetical protein
MRRNKRYSKAKSNKHPVLWMLTGLLIGVFVCSLTFLKKKEAVVADHPEQTQTALASKAVVKHKTKGQESKKNHDESTEQYDFYTMLPKMQSNQSGAQPETPAPAPAPKPTKPLAVAEQSMLSPGTKPDVTAAAPPPPQQQTPPSAPTPQAPAATQANAADSSGSTVTTPAPQAKKYTVTAGSFDRYDQADAEKATLVLAGITHAKIQPYASNGSTHYRLNLGSFSSKAAATKILDQLKDAQLSGSIEAT